jgi:hypothetical protein
METPDSALADRNVIVSQFSHHFGVGHSFGQAVDMGIQSVSAMLPQVQAIKPLSERRSLLAIGVATPPSSLHNQELGPFVQGRHIPNIIHTVIMAMLGDPATLWTNGTLDLSDYLDLDERIVFDCPQHFEFWQSKRNCDTILLHLGTPSTSGGIPEIVHGVPSFPNLTILYSL